MTSGLPQVRPGAIAQPDAGLIDRIRRLEILVEELSRKDMNRATVGQGGTFRGYYDNGQLAFTFGEDLDDGVRKIRMNYPSTGTQALQVGPGNPNVSEPEQFRLRDQSNKNMFATDGIAGYGLAEPGLTYMFTPRFNGLSNATNTAGTEYEVATADAIFYNPAVLCQVLCTASVAYAFRVALFVDNVEVATSTITNIAAGGAQYLTKLLLLPSDVMNRQNVKIKALLKPGTTASTPVWPTICHGKSKTYYDLNPALQ